MTYKTAVIRTRVSPAVRKKLEALALSEGLNVSELLRLVVEQVTQDVDVPEDASSAAHPKRESKVTVRLPEDVAGHLAVDAKRQGLSVSTWAASILMAKFRSAPQPVKSQRSAIRRAFRQLQGLATNTNQMATVMNRGVFTGESYAPSRQALLELRRGIAELRSDLSRFAKGQYDAQKVPGSGDE